MQRDELELDLPPAFEIGQKVRIRKLIKNDGTFPGQEIGAVLAKRRYWLCIKYRYFFTKFLYLCRPFFRYRVRRRLS